MNSGIEGLEIDSELDKIKWNVDEEKLRDYLPTIPKCIEEGRAVNYGKTATITYLNSEPISQFMMYIQGMRQSEKYKFATFSVLGIKREDIWNNMEEGYKCAEIGVKKGEHGLLMMACKPKYLYLIDVWDKLEGSYGGTNAPTLWYEDVKRKFKDYNNVKIIKDYSDKAAKEWFKDDYLDFVYIDGDHSYEGVKKDLEAYDKKIKDDGFIIGHDFIHATTSDLKNKKLPQIHNDAIGAIKAVNEFINERNYYLAFITNEVIPSYFIAKDPSSPKFINFMNRLNIHINNNLKNINKKIVIQEKKNNYSLKELREKIQHKTYNNETQTYEIKMRTPGWGKLYSELTIQQKNIIPWHIINDVPCWSSNGQDYFVLHHLNFKKSGFFIEICVSDGINKNSTYTLEKNYKWDGLCINNQFDTYNIYLKTRKCKLLRSNCSFSSLDKTNIPKTIDYLSLCSHDKEYNAFLNGFDFENYKILIISILKPEENIINILEKNGYLNVIKLGADTIFMHSSIC